MTLMIRTFGSENHLQCRAYWGLGRSSRGFGSRIESGPGGNLIVYPAAGDIPEAPG